MILGLYHQHLLVLLLEVAHACSHLLTYTQHALSAGNHGNALFIIYTVWNSTKFRKESHIANINNNVLLEIYRVRNNYITFSNGFHVTNFSVQFAKLLKLVTMKCHRQAVYLIFY